MLKLTAEITALAVVMYAGICTSCNLTYGQVNSNPENKPWWDRSKIAIAYGDVGG
ncbi:MAG: hypothetical protein QG588_180, partial [Candidatus Poribacteria bacterium]|nr:hypothetical protein [Candidatus Poribacteria bacterium]